MPGNELIYMVQEQERLICMYKRKAGCNMSTEYSMPAQQFSVSHADTTELSSCIVFAYNSMQYWAAAALEVLAAVLRLSNCFPIIPSFASWQLKLHVQRPPKDDKLPVN